MPYQKMSPEEPEYMTRKALGQMFLRFASTVRPNVSMSTVVTSGKFDHTAKQWTFGLRRDGKDYSIKAKHVAFATGSSSQDPYIPDFPGRVQILFLQCANESEMCRRKSSKAIASIPSTLRMRPNGKANVPS